LERQSVVRHLFAAQTTYRRASVCDRCTGKMRKRHRREGQDSESAIGKRNYNRRERRTAIYYQPRGAQWLATADWCSRL